MNTGKLLPIILFCAFLIPINSVYSQSPNTGQKPSFKERLSLETNFGLQFGTITLVDISPNLTYNITQNLIGGLGLSYLYYNDSRFSPSYSSSIYGGRLFARYFVFENIFAHAEYELLSYKAASWPSGKEDFISVSGLIIGGGYRQWISNRAYSTIAILFNLNDDINYPYSNPLIRVGIGFYLK